MPQPLNSKESSLFRQVIRNYDLKQYKKGALESLFPTVCVRFAYCRSKVFGPPTKSSEKTHSMATLQLSRP